MSTETVIDTPKPVITSKETPYAFIEFLVHGEEKDKKKIQKMMEDLQQQMYKLKKGSYCRILWYIDKGEKTEEEKKQWLNENSNARYTVVMPKTYRITPTYFKTILDKVLSWQKAVKEMQTSGIQIQPKKPKSQEQ